MSALLRHVSSWVRWHAFGDAHGGLTSPRFGLGVKEVVPSHVPTPPMPELVPEVSERDRWIRLFNRLDAAVSRHRTAKEAGFADDADDALAAAHDRILKAAAKK